MTTRRDKKVECPNCGKLFDVNDYSQCPKCKEEYFRKALEHWAKLFRDGILSEDFAEDIASVLEDKAHNLRERS